MTTKSQIEYQYLKILAPEAKYSHSLLLNVPDVKMFRSANLDLISQLQRNFVVKRENLSKNL